MWGPESPNLDSTTSNHCHSLSHTSSTTIEPDSLRAPALQDEGLQTPTSSSDSLDSLGAHPNSQGTHSSPRSVLDSSSSIQSDSLDSLAGRNWEEVPSFSLLWNIRNQYDSLESIPVSADHLRSTFSLGDSLETSSIQLDSLQSVTSLRGSTQASSIQTDSLDSPCSLCDSLETSIVQRHRPGSYSI